MVSMQHPPKHILVVDDEADILEFLQVILEEEGYEVVTSVRPNSSNNCTTAGCPTCSCWMCCSPAKTGAKS